MYQNLFRNVAGSLLCSALLCSARTYIVGKPNTPCPNAQYPTISAAVAAAAPGDLIEICPALYDEQLLITKPLTLRGLEVRGMDRVLLQPGTLSPVGGLSASEAVITVMNTSNVAIQNLAIDASKNTIQGCGLVLAGVHFFNASGLIERNAIFGAMVSNPQSCPLLKLLLYGTGFGVQVDASGRGPYDVTIRHNSIHHYTRNGILAVGSAVRTEIKGNTISGIGPAAGVFQFGVFLSEGAVGRVHGNGITEGLCGTLSFDACVGARSEGVVLRGAGDGTLIDENVITNAQSGIFVNGGNNVRITNNLIRNIEGLNGIDIQGSATGSFTNSLIARNIIANVGPVTAGCSANGTCCGIAEVPGTGVAANRIQDNTVNDAFCGVAYVQADHIQDGDYYNTLYTELNRENYPNGFPPAKETNQ